MSTPEDIEAAEERLRAMHVAQTVAQLEWAIAVSSAQSELSRLRKELGEES